MEEAETLQSETNFPLMAELFVANCQGWPTVEIPEGLREPLNSDIPTLLLSGEADPITPPRYAEQVAQGLSNSEMITLQGYGHGILSVGCIPALVTDFIEAGTVEGLDTSCTEEITPPPFFISPAGPRP
jgi:pimeloyl-ACP methyl ester carboxylesterase